MPRHQHRSHRVTFLSVDTATPFRCAPPGEIVESSKVLHHCCIDSPTAGDRPTTIIMVCESAAAENFITATAFIQRPASPAPTPISPGRLLHQAGVPEGDQPQRLLFRSVEAQMRWAENRARGWFPTMHVGRGNAPGSEASRQRARTLTLVCTRVGCSALVNRARARQHAHAAGRTSFLPGDGCASRLCSRDFRPKRFGRAQRRVAAAVESGERLLICWQSDVRDHDVWVRPAAVAHRAAAEARAALSI